MAPENSDLLVLSRPQTPHRGIDGLDADTRRGEHGKQHQEIGTPSTPTSCQIVDLRGEEGMTEVTRSSERNKRRVDKYRDAHRALMGKLSQAAVQLSNGTELPKKSSTQSSPEKDSPSSPSKKAKGVGEPQGAPGVLPVFQTVDESQQRLRPQFDGSTEDASRDAALKAAGYCPACDGQASFKCCSLCDGNIEYAGKGKRKEILSHDAAAPSIQGDLKATCCTIDPVECPAEHEQQPVDCCQPGEKVLPVSGSPPCCNFCGADRSTEPDHTADGPEKAAATSSDDGNSYSERPVPGAFPLERGQSGGKEAAEVIDFSPKAPPFARNLSDQKVRTIYGQVENASVEQVKDWVVTSRDAAAKPVGKVQRECSQLDEGLPTAVGKEKLPKNRMDASSSRVLLIPPRFKSSGRKSSGFIAREIPSKQVDESIERGILEVPPSKTSPLRRKFHFKHGDNDRQPTEKQPTPYFDAWKKKTSIQGSETYPKPMEEQQATVPETSASGSNQTDPIIQGIDFAKTNGDAVVGTTELSSNSSDEIPLRFAAPKPVSESESPLYVAPPSNIQPEMTRAELKAHQKATKALEKLAQKEAKKKEKVDKSANKRSANFDGPGSAAESDGQRSASFSRSQQRDTPTGEMDSARETKTSGSLEHGRYPGDPLKPDSTTGDAHFTEDVEAAGQDLQPERPFLTEEDNKRIRKKTDKVILAILVWVYFLQILDKSVLGYGSIFGLQKDTHLVKDQYSLIGSIAPIAQLAWQPFSSILIVKVPHRILMPSLVLGWGIAQTLMAACHNFPGLLATRFFLGLFEAGCLPLFGVITNQWYRRSEQPIRVAAWYGTNGAATIVASALSYGLGHIPSEALKSWQIIFLFVGLVTIASAPVVYWKLDNGVTSARFLTNHEKIQAVERLRANQTGIGSRKFEWSHVKEVALEPKTYGWIAMSLLVNVGASVTNTFGPLILSGFGFDKYKTSLLNMPFGFVQLIIILFSSYAAQKWKLKSAVLLVLVLPVIAGLVVLYVVPRGKTAPLLVGYYLLAFLFGSNPLIVSWIIGNTAGTTKKSVIMSLYNAGSSAGNIIGPLLFSSKDAPSYLHGLKAVLAIFATLAVVVVLQTGLLFTLNKGKEKERVRNGKARKLRDASMEDRWESSEDPSSGLGQHAFDRTDGRNDEFVYIY